MARAKRMWTLGYEGHDPESIASLLRAHKIQRVVDIRELPLSRKAGFSKSALALGLSRHGIAYTHLRALGTPRALRHAYKAGGAFEAFRDGYLAHVAGQERAVEELEALAHAARVALLCVEAEHETCHRGVLAEAMAPRGWRFEHV
jgi:uncharacterized protein (DUF488 family)